MVDRRAATGFAGAAGAYERGRPSYPPELVARLARELGLGPASTALDLAAGTGKLTRLLAPHAGRIVAVDPSEPMLAVLRERFPHVDARAGTAEAIPLPDGSVRAVFVGEAFHWFRTAEASREIARVLAPGGGLALLWNRAVWTERELPWLPAFRALVEPHRRAAGPYPGAEPASLALPGFGPPAREDAEHVHRIGAADFVALVASWSWIANLPDGTRTALLREVAELVGPHEPLALRYRTDALWARLA